MKLTYFYATIEVAPRDGYSESLQCSTDRNDKSKLKFTFPYGEITPEQAAAVNEFTKTLTAAYNKLQKQIDNVNQELKLEQYAAIVPPVVETTSSDFDLDAKSEVIEEACSPEGSNSAQALEVSTEEAELEEGKTIRDID